MSKSKSSSGIKDLFSLKWLKKDKTEESVEITGPTGFQRNVHVSIDEEGDKFIFLLTMKVTLQVTMQ
jgi:hypothetical protein